jgi:hypothetical protein
MIMFASHVKHYRLHTCIYRYMCSYVTEVSKLRGATTERHFDPLEGEFFYMRDIFILNEI